MSLSQEARTKLINLFSFFKAVEERKTTLVRNIEDRPWTLRWADLPKSPTVQIRTPATGDDFSFSLKRPNCHLCPLPPAVIADWLKPGWESPDDYSEHFDQRTMPDAEGRPQTIRFDQARERVSSWHDWTALRDSWVNTERPVRAAFRIWERLFALHSQLQREGEAYELVLGDGIFDSHGLHHPILLRPVELEFESQTRTFTLQDAATTSQFYSALFANMPNLPVKEWQQQAQDGELHPLGGQGVTDWLHTVIGAFQDGQLLQDEPLGTAPYERLGRAPFLFLRKRDTGRLNFLDEILADLQTTDAVRDSLLRTIGCFTEQNALSVDKDSAYANEDADILLSKPANAAQLSILRRLTVRGCVLVQGPPGTGKTHTIANLIGSLLAEGKTVLVTSHTTKALRVLRQQVVEPLRDLCVSVLDSDLAGKKELELAVRNLATRLDDDLSRLRRDGDENDKHRKQLIQDLHQSRADLELAINGEYRSLVLEGKEIRPVDAAKEVAQGVGLHDWLPGPVKADTPLPLSLADINTLYASTGTILPQDELELGETLPVLSQLWSPACFERWVQEFTSLNASLLAFRRDLWKHSNADGDLELTLMRMCEGLEILARSEEEAWRLAAIEAGMAGEATRRIWELACEDIKAVQRQADAAAELIYRHTPQPPEDGDWDMWLVVVEEIIAFLGRGKVLSGLKLLWNPRWKQFIESTTIDGSTRPARMEHFQALHAELRVRQLRAGLVLRWKKHLEPLGLPSLSEAPDPLQFAAQHVPSINACLNWHAKQWRPIEAELEALGLDWPRLLEEAPPSTSPHHRAERLRYTVLQPLRKVIDAERTRCRQAQLLAEFTEYEQVLSRYHGVSTVRMLAEAVNLRNVVAYCQQHRHLEHLLVLQPVWRERQDQLRKIRAVAPEWARAIEERQSPHDRPYPPGASLDAWRWRQLCEELDRRAALSIPALQNGIERLSKELMHTTTSLVESRAWSALIARTRHDQIARQSLIALVKLWKKIGAGTGKDVEKLKREANKLMKDAKRAVPAWIMPFSRVTENFHPVRDHFDVLIVDEASQENVVGLAPFYLADKVIVVGDDEQVTPLDVGSATQPVQDLIGQWLGDLPSPLLFDLKTSIYDRAQIAFDASIRLKEHFRCVPEIIQFSNHLSYGGDIKPLRESASTLLKPALVAHRVNGCKIGKKNREEAETVAAMIAAAIEYPEYAGKTFGVISLLGEEQAREIEALLRTHLDTVEYEKRRILCGNPGQFQGDERDVIFLSMVDSKEDGEGPLGMKGDGADGMWKKRYNVAASRAKDQLWVVYSLDHQTQLKPGDLRRRLIEHAVDPNALMSLLSDANVKTESPFEADVYQRLVAAGYRVTTQWSVGAYRIDLVIEGEQGRRLAIECDGDRWHYDKVAEDLARQALLERLGWHFVRIGGIAFYRNKLEAMVPVFEKLAVLGISPMAVAPSNPTLLHANMELLDGIRRRAAEIRQGWSPQYEPEILSLDVL